MKRRSEAGFTLIEVLIAFVVLTMVVTACLNVYAGSARAEARAQQADAAAALIRERLGALETLNLRPGSGSEGQAGNMRWSIEVSPSNLGAESGQPERGLAWIVVRVTDASGLVHSATTARWIGEAFREGPSS